MNVTLRPNGHPDVYVADNGSSLNLSELEKQIRTLLTARRWLKRELELRETK